jgi:hypothetical protein
MHRSHAGLLFFAVLLVLVIRSPPTPMAMRRGDVESLWQVISHNLGSTSSSVMHQLHALQTIMTTHMHPASALRLVRGACCIRPALAVTSQSH